MNAATADAELAAALDALRGVYDPELALDIVSLGFVYDLRAEGNRVVFDMTLTTPGCPVSESLPDQAAAAIAEALGPGGAALVELHVVWDPPAMVHLGEFAIEPKQVTGGRRRHLAGMNSGTVPHNLAVQKTMLATKMIDAGVTDNLSLTGLSAGTYTVYCQVPGHEQAGMVATLRIGGGAAGTPAATPVANAGTPTPGASADATIDFNATPAASGHAFDPALKPADGATVHNVTFRAPETLLRVDWTSPACFPPPAPPCSESRRSCTIAA